MLPSTDRSYEYFWRQAARWLVPRKNQGEAITEEEGADADEVLREDASRQERGAVRNVHPLRIDSEPAQFLKRLLKTVGLLLRLRSDQVFR